jgi:hypothetical protein
MGDSRRPLGGLECAKITHLLVSLSCPKAKPMPARPSSTVIYEEYTLSVSL